MKKQTGTIARRLGALGAAAALFTALLTGCSATTTVSEPTATAEAAAATPTNDDIVILYTNDVHCGVEDNIGYAGLAAYKAAMLKKTPYVSLVDCGDAVQGDLIGSVSMGEYIIDLMNDANYDLAILGNHEFDYGMDQLKLLIDMSKADYLGCNIRYTGTGESALADVKPYKILDYGDTKVGYIGVSTPYSVRSSSPIYFMDENGEFIYNFCADTTEEFYGCVQSTVDEVRAAGADYVILLTHLGDSDDFSPFSSVALIGNTSGVDAVLDGHEHHVIPCRVEQNKDGEEVLLSSTGTKLANIGQLVITPSGTLTTTLISEYAPRDEIMTGYIADINKSFEAEMNAVVAHSDTALSCADEAGTRLVRNRETTIGDFCADAYRAASGADIAFVNGGGIRADLPAGDITYGDIIAVHPYGNTLCMVEATGQEVLDALEMGAARVTANYGSNGNAEGENGGFLQVSGLTFTIDTSIPTSVTYDENNMFAAVEGARRVGDVMVVAADGTATPLDPAATYKLASHSYLIKKGGDGDNLFMDNTLLIDEGMADYQMLINYLTTNLNGQLSAYDKTGDRITVK